MLRGIKINSVTAREFLFFLLFTTIIAGLIKLSKTYKTQFEVAIEVVDVPIDRTIQELTPAYVKVSAEGSGFSLLTNAIEVPTLKVPFTELQSVESHIYEYTVTARSLSQKEVVDNASNVLAIVPPQIRIAVDSVASKRIPVQSNVAVSYKTGYGAKSKLRIEPDSITVVGPATSITSIKEVFTIGKELMEVDKKIAQEVALSTQKLPQDVRLSQIAVNIVQDVAKYTEGKIIVPITILNDLDTQVKILPKTAEVSYIVELENFDKITPSDFLVTCDYENATDNDAYLPLKIAKAPATVKVARLINKQVKFIVIN
ncbi:YbbR-like domain-containing protein [Dokdonia donghaensis]|uniref:YbbR-like domain-containing protein n=1 Tax=Dokdonia donghaensis DSW-1 TaxID=1300343 RepID=A0A0A2GUN0_9FLAO|nr:hypothetical protein [Dokdonia donghaensis]ANH61633.1 hypothetical protein I597_2742 [Dokdonia donghaensis DSW-1]KGO06228.1 hypothetical protein NV36_04850 [Dokdonia donghaensis DSW-1]